MKNAIYIDGVKYTAHTRLNLLKTPRVFYPMVRFSGRRIGKHESWINIPYLTRSKALTAAKKHIRSLAEDRANFSE